MKKQNIFISILILVAAAALGVWLGHRSVTTPGTSTSRSNSGDKTFTLLCDTHKQLSLTFHLPSDATVDVATSDGRTMTLANTSTGSAASYSTADGSTVLSLAGATLTLTEKGIVTYANCVLNTAASGSASVAQ